MKFRIYFFGATNCLHGVFRVKVSADHISIFLRQHRASHNGFNTWTLFMNKPYCIFHRGNCSRHQSTESDKPCAALYNSLINPFGRNISSKIYNFKSVIFKKNFNNVFSNVMYISLYRCKNNFVTAFVAVTGKLGSDNLKAALAASALIRS